MNSDCEPRADDPEFKAFEWAMIYQADWCDGLDGWKQMEIREAWFKYQEEQKSKQLE